jgi:hypothetical protein
VVSQVAAGIGNVHLGERCVVRGARGDHHVVDRGRHGPEERVETGGIVSVKRGVAARADVDRGTPEALRVTAGEDDLGAFGAGASGSFESDAGAAIDQHDGLPEQAGSRTAVEPSVRVVMMLPISGWVCWRAPGRRRSPCPGAAGPRRPRSDRRTSPSSRRGTSVRPVTSRPVDRPGSSTPSRVVSAARCGSSRRRRVRVLAPPQLQGELRGPVDVGDGRRRPELHVHGALSRWSGRRHGSDEGPDDSLAAGAPSTQGNTLAWYSVRARRRRAGDGPESPWRERSPAAGPSAARGRDRRRTRSTPSR